MASAPPTCMPYFINPLTSLCPNPAATGALSFDIGFRGCNAQTIGRYSSAGVTVVGNGQSISCRPFNIAADGSTTTVTCYTSPSALSVGAYSAMIQLTLASTLASIQGDSVATITVTPCQSPPTTTTTTTSVPPTVTTTITTTSPSCAPTLVSHLIQQTSATADKRDVVNSALLNPRAVLAMYSVETIYPSGCPVPTTTTSTTSSTPTTTSNSCKPTITLIPQQLKNKRGEATFLPTSYDTVTLYPSGCPTGTISTTTTTSQTTTTTATPAPATTSTTTVTSSSTSPSQCTAQSQIVSGRSCTVSCSTDRPGGDYSQSRTGSISACVQACAADARCVTAQYHEDSGFCYLKSVMNSAVAASGVDSVDCSVSISTSTMTTTTSTTTSNTSVRPMSVTTTTKPALKSSSNTSLSWSTWSAAWSAWSTYTTTKSSSMPTGGWTEFGTPTATFSGKKAPPGSVVTVILTTTYNIPCPTGWTTKTVTITTTYCGCTETPAPTVVPMTTYTTTCPPSWGFTTPLVVTVPVYVVTATAQVPQYTASPTPTWSVVTVPAASVPHWVGNTMTVTSSSWTAPTGTAWNSVGGSTTSSGPWNNVVVGTYKGGISKIGVSGFMGALAALAAFIV